MNTIINTYNNTINYLNQTKIGKFANSLIGRQIINSLVENAAEFGGYYAAAEMCGPIGKRIGGLLGSEAGGVSALALSVIGAGKSAQVVYTQTDRLRLLSRLLMTTAVFTVVLCALHQILFTSLFQWGHQGGEFLGEMVAYFGIGLVAAYFAMALCGTKEILWDSDKVTRSYIFKSVQSMLICALAERHNLFPEGEISSVLASQILGILAYHFLDIKDVATDFKNGTLLDGMPKTIDTQAFEGLVEVPLDEVADQAIATIPSIPHTNYTGDDSFDPIIASTMDDLQKMLKSELRSLIPTSELSTFIAETSGAAPAKEFVEGKFFSTIVRSCNKYCELLARYPDFFTYLSEGDRRAREISDSILEQYEMILNEIAPLDGVIRPQFAQLEKLKSLRLQLEKSINLLPLASPEQIETLASKIIEIMGQTEEETCGFKLFPKAQYKQAEQTLKLHIEWIVKIALLEALYESMGQCTEAEVRHCYKNLNALAHEFYAPVLGYLAPLTRRVVNHQLTHSRFQNDLQRPATTQVQPRL